MVEGAAGLAVAAFRKFASRFNGKKIVLVSCGSNINPKVIKNC